MKMWYMRYTIVHLFEQKPVLVDTNQSWFWFRTFQGSIRLWWFLPLAFLHCCTNVIVKCRRSPVESLVFFGAGGYYCAYISFSQFLIVPIPSPIHPYKKKSQKTATTNQHIFSSWIASQHLRDCHQSSVTAMASWGNPSDRSCWDLLEKLSPSLTADSEKIFEAPKKKGHPVAFGNPNDAEASETSRTYWLFFEKKWKMWICWLRCWFPKLPRKCGDEDGRLNILFW